MMKKVRIVGVLLICFLLTGSDNYLKEVKAASADSEIDLLLYEDSNIKEVVEEIREICPDILITEYRELSLLHLELSDQVSTEDIITNETVNNKIELAGNMPDIELGRIDLGATYSGEPVINGLQDNKKIRMTEEDLFDLLAWHVDEVTEGRRSFEISTGKGVRIALIDSGVDYNHPLLVENIDLKNARSYIPGDGSVADTNGHGTMVAGVLKQISPNSIITPYRVIGDTTGDSSAILKAIIEAVNDGNDIINASVGTYKCKDIKSEKLIIKAFERAIKYAKKNDVIVIASAGNLGLNLDEYYKLEKIKHLPGGINGVNSVSAVLGQKLTSYSNYGSDIKYCAPGGDLVYIDGYLDLDSMIYCLYPTSLDNGLQVLGIPQGYTFSYGTSFSAPIVTAGSADVMSYYRANNIRVKSKDVTKALSKGAEDLGRKGKDKYYGDGQINIFNSLKCISSEVSDK